MTDKKLITIPELAKLLGVSRVTIYKRVKEGQIPATKVGRMYVITDESVAEILGKRVTKKDKERINLAVDKTMREYGDVLKRLGNE